MTEHKRAQLSTLFYEFARYLVVGGVAFIADFVTLWLLREYTFPKTNAGVYYAAAGGFCIGLIVNYLLSLWFVFTQPHHKGKGRSIGAFCIFGVIGLIGLALTELGMWAGLKFHIDYRLAKIIITGIVLVWNYLARKIIIFK